MDDQRTHLIITVHGIRTFGKWQERLEALTHQAYEGPNAVTFCNYKYGYFSVFAFLFPPLRWLVVRRFRNELRKIVKRLNPERIDLVGHSFGTHILAWALWGLKDDEELRIHTIILSGSVLRAGFAWVHLLEKRVKRVVNDCGARDSILILSQFLVLFTGMAGRTGFSGMTNSNFRNRFSNFGHSGYFQNSDGSSANEYMKKNWVPLLIGESSIPAFHNVPDAGAWDGAVIWLSNNAEPVKLTLYITPVVLLGLWIWEQRNEAIRQQQIAEQERKQAVSAKAMLVGKIADREIEEHNYGTAIALSLEFLKGPERNQDQITPELLRPLYAGTHFNIEHEPLVHTDAVRGFSITDDERTLVSTTEGGGICVWDMERNVVRAAFSPQGRRIELPNSSICSITQRDTRPTSELVSLLTPVQKLVAEISPDGAYIAYANDKRLALLETSNLVEVKSLESPISIIALSFGPRSNELFYATEGGPVAVAGAVLERAKGWTGKALPPIRGCEGKGEVIWSQDQSIIFYDAGIQCVWNRRTGKTKKLAADDLTVEFSASMSRDGGLAIPSLELNQRNHINVVDPISGQVKAEMPVAGTEFDLDDATVSPNGKTIAIVEDQGVLSLWDVAKKRKTRLDVTATRGSATAFSNSGELMIRVSSDQIDVWRMRDKEKIAVLGGHHTSFGQVVIGPRDSKIFVVSDETIRVFSLEQNNEFFRTFLGHTGPSEAEFLAKNNLLISLDWSPAIRLFEAKSGIEKSSLQYDLVDEVILGQSDSLFLAKKNTIEIISKSNFDNRIVVTLNHNVMGIGVDPSGRWFACTDDAGDVYLWSKSSGLKKIGSGNKSMRGDVIVAPSGDRFAVRQADGKVAFFSSSGAPIISPTRTNEINEPADEVVWDPQGEKVAVTTLYGDFNIDVDRKGSFQVWNVVSRAGAGWSKSPTLPSLVRSFAWHPRQAVAALGMQDGSVAIWNAAENTVKQTWRDHGDYVKELTWSPDGKWLVSGDFSTTVVRDWQSGEILKTISQPISGDRSGGLESANSAPATKENGGSVKSVAFSPDGRRLATISSTGETIELVDISSRMTIAKLNTEEEPLDGQDAPEPTVRFSADGKWLISTHIGKSARLWKVWDDLDELEKDACRSWSGPLTKTERKQLNLTPNSPVLCQRKQAH